ENRDAVEAGNAGQTLAAVTSTPGAADASTSTLTPVSSSITAGTGTQVLTVTAKDAFGNATGTGSDTVTIVKDSGTGSVGSVTDNGDGTYTATVTAPNATGSGVFKATLNSDPGKSGNAQQTLATVTYTAGALDHITITPDGGDTIVAGSVRDYTAEAFDQYGNSRGDVTADTTFSITPDGSCDHNECGSTI